MGSAARTRVTEQVNTHRTTRRTVHEVVAALEAEGWKATGVRGRGKKLEITLSHPQMDGHRRVVYGEAAEA